MKKMSEEKKNEIERELTIIANWLMDIEKDVGFTVGVTAYHLNDGRQFASVAIGLYDGHVSRSVHRDESEELDGILSTSFEKAWEGLKSRRYTAEKKEAYRKYVQGEDDE